MPRLKDDAGIRTLLELPSLQPFMQTLSSLLSSSSPPPCIHIHSPTNQNLILPILKHLLERPLHKLTTSLNGNVEPTIQEVLPKASYIPLTAVHSTRQLFDRILNDLSGFVDENGIPAWDDELKSGSNWDGRTEGCRVVRRRPREQIGLRKRTANASRGKGRQGKRARLEDHNGPPEEVRGEGLSGGDKGDGETDDGDERATEQEWTIEWDRSIPPEKQAIAPIHDTLDHFFTSLQTIFALGEHDSRAAIEDDEHYDSDAEDFAMADLDSSAVKFRAHRFIVFDQAERLSDLPSAGTAGGAPKETGLGMTFANALKRVGPLTRLPVTTILISKLGPAKCREGLVGNVEPYSLVFPDLSGAGRDTRGSGIVALLKARFAATNPTTDTLNTEQTLDLFGSLVEVVWSNFSKTQNEVNSLAHIVAKFWPKWVDCLENSNPRIDPKNTSALFSHLRVEFQREHERLGAPRQALDSTDPLASPTKKPGSTSVAASIAPAMHGFVGSIPDLPSGPNYLPSPASSITSPIRPLVASNSTASSSAAPPLVLFDPIPAQNLFAPSIAPLRKQAAEINAPSSSAVARQARADQTLAKSLPLIGKMLLIASFYAAFNPPKSDVAVFVKIDEGIAKKGQKGRKKTYRPGTSPTKAASNALETGGKAFPLERLLAIFEALLDDPTLSSTIDVHMQVTTLINLRLLQRVSAQDKVLEGIKLKCKVGFETVDVLAGSCRMKDWKTRLWNVEM